MSSRLADAVDAAVETRRPARFSHRAGSDTSFWVYPDGRVTKGQSGDVDEDMTRRAGAILADKKGTHQLGCCVDRVSMFGAESENDHCQFFPRRFRVARSEVASAEA